MERSEKEELNSKLQQKDKTFRELLLEKITKSDYYVRIFLGWLKSIFFLQIKQSICEELLTEI